MKFTDQQIKSWLKYEKVRQSGLYNMWTPQAREATGLNRDDYRFCMEHYSELKSAADKMLW